MRLFFLLTASCLIFIKNTDAQCWQQVALGAGHSAAIKSDGSLWTWGGNSHGQIGNDTKIDQNMPQQIAGDWVQVAVGTNFTAAIKSDGTLWEWGDNGHGQLGDGTHINQRLPVQVGTDNNWRQIATGYAHTLALKNDSTLWAWGWKYFGQLGDGSYIFNGDQTAVLQAGNAHDWDVV
ncbi:MAG: hypothetical protein ABIQ93_17365, partial [Saprospiraceae bacterium]